MTEFTFGEVDAVLSALNDIAIHKRVAFTGRLKFLLKNGLPTRARPGRGKAATYSFSDLMQLAFAVELMQAGMDQKRAASLVQHNWLSVRHTIYMATFTESEVREMRGEDAEVHDPRDWVWTIDMHALRDLTPDGVSEYDDYEAVSAMDTAGAASILAAQTALPGRRSTLVVHGGPLTARVVYLVAFAFKFASVAEMRADIEADMDLEREQMLDLDARIREFKKALTPEKREEIRRQMEEADGADYSTHPPTPTSLLAVRAREMLPRLSPGARALLADAAIPFMRDGNSFSLINDDATRDALKELIDFDVFAVFHRNEDTEIPAMGLDVSPFGRAAMKVALEDKGENDGDR